MQPIRILFVCHGNICRSPMAQSIMQHLVDTAGQTDNFVIDSAAATNEELGNPMYPCAQDQLREEGVPIMEHRARKISRSEGGEWDYIVCMDDENVHHLRGILDAKDMQRVWKLLDFTSSEGQQCAGRNVADPWFTRNFQTAFDDINAGCQALLQTVIG